MIAMILYWSQFVWKKRFGQGTRLFAITVISRLRVELQAKDLGESSESKFRLICEEMLSESTA